ncbi:hypothetical protein ACTQ49_10375 [Luteococcus sp. Sow4_B9]|uniref:hypothetical protein n=1 Tax=Luteococcus sp. Sow4_B9 TaxID=3438792 RepID=UPI003F9CFF7C
MDQKWWLATIVFPVLLALLGALLTYYRYRLEIRRYYGREVYLAGSGLLHRLHILNNTHLGEQEHPDRESHLRASWKARDAVWESQSQIRLIGSPALLAASEAMVAEYNTSSPALGDRRQPIDRDRRRELRNAFIEQWRRECPGLPGGRRALAMAARR